MRQVRAKKIKLVKANMYTILIQACYNGKRVIIPFEISSQTLFTYLE